MALYFLLSDGNTENEELELPSADGQFSFSAPLPNHPNPSDLELGYAPPPDAIPKKNPKPFGTPPPIVEVTDKEKPHIDGNLNSNEKEKILEAEAKPEPKDAVSTDEYVAICMAIKNQARDLPEFFVHHYHHL